MVEHYTVTPGVALVALLLLTGMLSAASTPAEALRRGRTSTRQQLKLLKKFLSNKELGLWMDEFIDRCPGTVVKYSIGKSVRGQDIWVLEISDKPGQDEAEPNFKYIANMHGDETSGRMVLPMLAEWLCENNGKNDTATRIVRDMHLFLIPTMNPDGYQVKHRNNKAGFDLNRNFPDQYKDKGVDLTQPAGDTQPEVASVMRFSLNRTWVMGASFHEGAMVANYPYDGYPTGQSGQGGRDATSPEDATYQYLAKTYSYKHSYMWQSQKFKDGITNGAAWYTVYGGMQDWDYVNAGSMHVTLEINPQKRPLPSKLPTLWEENREAVIALLQAALAGVRGTVTAAGTGQPLAAKLYVKDATLPPVPFRAGRVFGDYARPLAPGGAYTLVAEMEGYKAAEAVISVPQDGSGVVQDFELTAA